MADPLSIAASIIAVAGLATSSCQRLYDTIHRFSEAPRDLQQHLSTLRALQLTFAGIASLEDRMLPIEMLSSEFRERLHDCLVDLQAMETLAQSTYSQFSQGTRRRTLARARLSLGGQRQVLKSHVDRIEAYYRDFSLSLLLLITKLSLDQKNNVQVQEPPSKPCDSIADQERLPAEAHESSPEPIHRYHDEICLRSSVWWRWKTVPLRLHASSGTVTALRGDNSKFKKTGPTLGYGFTLASMLHGFCRYRLELTVYILANWTWPRLGTTLDWNFSALRIVPYDSEAFGQATCGDLNGLKMTLGKKALSVNDVTQSGSTLLHYAAQEGQYEIALYLIQSGARIDAMDNCGDTPLHFALSCSQHYDVCRLLLDHGSDIHNRNSGGGTALHAFANPTLWQVMSRCRDDINLAICDKLGRTILHYLAWSRHSTPASLQHFLEGYQSPSIRRCMGARDIDGCTPLHLAAQRGNAPLTTSLLSLTPEPLPLRIRDRAGRTPLHYAIQSRRAPETIEALMAAATATRAPSYARLRDYHGRTALCDAVALRNAGAMTALLAFEDKGESAAEAMLLQDYSGVTPLQLLHEWRTDSAMAKRSALPAEVEKILERTRSSMSDVESSRLVRLGRVSPRRPSTGDRSQVRLSDGLRYGISIPWSMRLVGGVVPVTFGLVYIVLLLFRSAMA